MSTRQQLAKFKNQIVTAEMVVSAMNKPYPETRIVSRYPQQAAFVEAPRVYIPAAAYACGRFLSYRAAHHTRRAVKVLIRSKGRLTPGKDAMNLETFN